MRAGSFYDLVGASEERMRNIKVESLRGLKIYHQLELRRCLNGEIAGLFAVENAVHANSRISKFVGIAAITH
jgi:hypothetical protein